MLLMLAPTQEGNAEKEGLGLKKSPSKQHAAIHQSAWRRGLNDNLKQHSTYKAYKTRNQISWLSCYALRVARSPHCKLWLYALDCMCAWLERSLLLLLFFFFLFAAACGHAICGDPQGLLKIQVLWDSSLWHMSANCILFLNSPLNTVCTPLLVTTLKGLAATPARALRCGILCESRSRRKTERDGIPQLTATNLRTYVRFDF